MYLILLSDPTIICGWFRHWTDLLFNLLHLHYESIEKCTLFHTVLGLKIKGKINMFQQAHFWVSLNYGTYRRNIALSDQPRRSHPFLHWRLRGPKLASHWSVAMATTCLPRFLVPTGIIPTGTPALSLPPQSCCVWVCVCARRRLCVALTRGFQSRSLLRDGAFSASVGLSCR